MASRINADSSNGLQLVSDSSGEVQIQANGITKATVNSNGISDANGVILSSRPVFAMTNSGSNQSITSGVKTKVTLDTSVIDTNNAIDIANSKIVIPSGMGGIYSINYSVRVDGASNSQLGFAIGYLQKNGGEYNRVYNAENNNLARANHLTRTTILELNAGDELELYAQANTSSSTPFVNVNTQYTELSGFKLIG